MSPPFRHFAPILSLLLGGAVSAAILPHAPLVPNAEELRRLARVRALLNSSTAERRNPVHIVFYGQSITQGPWWREVADELRRLYPFADLRIENRAISGFQDWALAKTVEADLIPLQPDLVIFHAYGTDNGTDVLLGKLRTGTVTDVIVQSDHPHLDNALEEDTDPATISPNDAIPYRNYVRLPADADRHGACLARVRDAWKDYCRTNGLTPWSLLADGIHPNTDGNRLMAEFVLAYLQPGPVELNPDDNARVRTITLGTEVRWHTGELECAFTGSALMAELDGELNGDVEVWIDGKRASEQSVLYGVNRVSPTHFSAWPALSHVGNLQPLLEETWTLTPFNLSDGGLNFSFRVHGSITGPDGEGTNTVRFVSNSGRVVIEPGEHWIPFSVRYSGNQPLPDGYRATWQVERHFHDLLIAGQQPPADLPRRLRLVQGLPDAPHRLRLVARGPTTPNLRALQVYSPAGKAEIRDGASVPPAPDRLRVSGSWSGTVVRWPATLATWTLEFSQELGNAAEWQPVPGGEVEAVGEQLQHRLPAGLSYRFFRLREPQPSAPGGGINPPGAPRNPR